MFNPKTEYVNTPDWRIVSENYQCPYQGCPWTNTKHSSRETEMWLDIHLHEQHNAEPHLWVKCVDIGCDNPFKDKDSMMVHYERSHIRMPYPEQYPDDGKSFGVWRPYVCLLAPCGEAEDREGWKTFEDLKEHFQSEHKDKWQNPPPPAKVAIPRFQLDAEPGSKRAGKQPARSPESSSLSSEADSGAEEPRERIMTMVHGQEVDITGLGIDLDFLEGLPDEMREDVIMEQRAAQREPSTSPGADRGLLEYGAQLREALTHLEAFKAAESGNELDRVLPSIEVDAMEEDPLDDPLAGIGAHPLAGIGSFAQQSNQGIPGISVAGSAGKGASSRAPSYPYPPPKPQQQSWGRQTELPDRGRKSQRDRRGDAAGGAERK